MASKSQQSLFDFIQASIKKHEPSNKAERPEGFIPLTLGAVNIPESLTYEDVEEFKTAVARLRGTFSYLPMSDLYTKCLKTEEQARMMRNLGVGALTDQLPFHFATLAIPAIDAAYDELGKKVAAWVFLITSLIEETDEAELVSSSEESSNEEESQQKGANISSSESSSLSEEEESFSEKDH